MKKVLFILLAICLVYCNKKKDDNPTPEEEKPVYLTNPTAFFATKSMLYAIDADSGTLRWKQNVSVFDNNELHGTPTYSNGMVYLVQGGSMTAYDAITGTLKWSTYAGGLGLTVKYGNIYSSDGGGDTYSIDKKTGTINWTLQGNKRSIVDAISCSPYVKDSVLYSGNREATLFALDANTGAKKWTFGSIYDHVRLVYRPVVDNGVVYFRTGSGLIAADAANGKEKWRVPFYLGLSDFSYSNPTLSKGVLYATSYDTLYSISTPDGKINWKFDADEPGRFYTSPAVWNNLVFITVYGNWSLPSFIYAVDINTGLQVWKYKGKDVFSKSATIYNGNLYIGSSAGMQVFDPASGIVKWTFTPENNEAVATGMCIVDTKNQLYTVPESGDYENK